MAQLLKQIHLILLKRLHTNVLESSGQHQDLDGYGRPFEIASPINEL